MKNKNLSWAAALFVFALLLWCTAATPGKIADPSTYTCAVYSTFFSLLPPVIAIVLALNTKEVYTSCLLYTSPSPRDRTRSRMPSSA